MSEITNKLPESITIEEFDRMPEDNSVTYELIDGKIIAMSRPAGWHQDVMRAITGELYDYFKGKPCRALTEVELEINENVIIPDISIFCNLETSHIQRFKQPPVLVIEILSPSNTITEMNNKMDKYKYHGIQEFWIVNPDNSTIAKYNLKDNINMTYIKSGSVKSTLFPDLEIKLSDIFE